MRFLKDKVDHIQFLLTRRCNLKCKYCIHYCNVKDYTEKDTYDIIQYEKDLEYVSNVLPNCKNIMLTGGEVTVLKNLTDYINITLKYFNSITISTNCINLNDDLIDYCRNHNISIRVSAYPCTYNIVKEKLKLENVNIYTDQNIECVDTMIVPKFYSKKHSSDMQAMIKCICNELTVFNSYVYNCPLICGLRYVQDLFDLNFDFTEYKLTDLKSEKDFLNVIRTPNRICGNCATTHKYAEFKKHSLGLLEKDDLIEKSNV